MKALLLSNVAVTQFAEYSYAASLGAGVTYVPAAKTIVMTAYLANNQDLAIMYGAQKILSEADMGGNSRGHIGATYCDGTNVGYKNENIAAKALALYGLTMT